MKKICKIHRLTEFSNAERSRCRKCQVIAVQKRREKVKELAVEYKGGCCNNCGYNKCIDALEFHHLNPEEKDFNLSHRGYCRSWKRVKQELDKCICVCANCHRETHSIKGEEA